jgi:hypothetical protein
MADQATLIDGGNVAEIRSVLWQTIQDIRSGKVKAAEANATSNTCGTWLRTVKLQLEYYKLVGTTPNIAALTAGDNATK